MKIRRYIGKTEQEAMFRLKKELGSEAIILHTRKIKPPGLLSVFKRSLVEIVAAVDESDTKQHQDKTSMLEKKLMNESFASNLESSSSPFETDIEWIKNTIENIAKKLSISPTDYIPDELQAIKQKLTDNGVDDYVSNSIIRDIKNQININGKDSETIKRIIKYNINSYLGKPEPINLDGKQKVVFFIGPTGVGKTTTLAKLAAYFTLKDKEKVGLITADTYRIAAVEQLKTYSEILNIPLEIIYKAEEMANVLSNFRNKDIILVDTAGRNHKNSEQITEIKEMLDTVINKEIYLVLNATTDFKTIKSIIKEYSFIENFKIIFTKVDEADNLGIILNTKFLCKNSLSYITTGQNVPEDIEVANIDKLSKSLIGELSYERSS